jgi:hypothetical protein
MSEIWPFFLIVGYIATLIFSSFKQPSLVREEGKYFCFYLFVGLAAMIVTADRYVWALNGCPSVEINLFGLLRNYWHSFVIPFFVAFTLLSLIRLPLLLLVNKKGK